MSWLYALLGLHLLGNGCDHNASLQSILNRCVDVEQTAAAIQTPTIVIVRRFAGVTTVFASISAR
jgi:hypothetical protein